MRNVMAQREDRGAIGTLDRMPYMTKCMVMNLSNIEKANIGMVKERLSAYVAMAERGKTVLVCRRNRPVARLTGAEDGPVRNRTRLDSAPGSVTLHCELTEPAMSEADWAGTK